MGLPDTKVGGLLAEKYALPRGVKHMKAAPRAPVAPLGNGPEIVVQIPSVASMVPFRLTPSMRTAVVPAPAQTVGGPQVLMGEPTGRRNRGAVPGTRTCPSKRRKVPRSPPAAPPA